MSSNQIVPRFPILYILSQPNDFHLMLFRIKHDRVSLSREKKKLRDIRYENELSLFTLKHTH